MKYACVFIGSTTGNNFLFSEKTIQLAKDLVQRNIGLVYGGANIGLMGLLADTVLEMGGEVIGVMPESLMQKEIAHKNLTHFHQENMPTIAIILNDALNYMLTECNKYLSCSHPEHKTMIDEMVVTLHALQYTSELHEDPSSWAQKNMLRIQKIATKFTALINHIKKSSQTAHTSHRPAIFLLRPVSPHPPNPPALLLPPINNRPTSFTKK